MAGRNDTRGSSKQRPHKLRHPARQQPARSSCSWNTTRSARRRTRVRQAVPGRLGGRARAGDDHPARRAVPAGHRVRTAGKGVGSAAAGRPARRRDPVPAALPGPGGQTSATGRSSGSGTARSQAIRRNLSDRGFVEGRGPGAAQNIQGGASARPSSPPQRTRHRPVPADRPGAAPQAARGGRHGAGVRDRPGVSATRASTPGTTPSSPCSRRTRRSPTTTT